MSTAAAETPLSVLYIEDNDSNLLLVKRIFRDRDNVALKTASLGQEGLDMARAEKPGLILLDLHLPDMLGVDVLAALRADPATAAIPVVAVSADATADQIKHLRTQGVADYVTKPFEVPRLLAVINSFASGEPPAPGDPAAASAREDFVLDPVRVAELFHLDPDGTTFRSITGVALDEAAEQIAVIAAAPNGGQSTTAVGAAAHGLRSSAAIMGAQRLASLAHVVEQDARAGSLPDASMLSELRRTLTVTRQATLDAIGEL